MANLNFANADEGYGFHQAGAVDRDFLPDMPDMPASYVFFVVVVLKKNPITICFVCLW